MTKKKAPAAPAKSSPAPAKAATPAKVAAPAAAAAAGNSGYVVKKGVVYLKDAKVGTIDAKGNYKVTDPQGKVHTGNISTLIRADVQAKLINRGKTGPTGRVRIGMITYEVRGGQVLHEGAEVGTVDGGGNYKLQVPGEKASAGHVQRTPGAVWLGKAEKAPSARIELAGKVFTAIDGVIFEMGEEIGRLAPDGRFRGVTLEGDHFEGLLSKMKEAVYLRLVRE